MNNNATDAAAVETQVLDTAFKLAKQAIPPLGHASAKEELERLFPIVSSDLITEQYLRATALVDACYDAGDQCRDGKMTEGKVLATLRERFPGFSSETYSKALSWGYFLSR